ncbi:hypothetical protein K0M31_006333 [Melipona bicolor]|uniref:Uncharacterized protein n=1 Tax=Melipona bicolor TaxID=60889 RepID=A0AA40FU23_9HYME|nr:hypothetical protein K0M31_006333 [Melipona bicolor]
METSRHRGYTTPGVRQRSLPLGDKYPLCGEIEQRLSVCRWGGGIEGGGLPVSLCRGSRDRWMGSTRFTRKGLWPKSSFRQVRQRSKDSGRVLRRKDIENEPRGDGATKKEKREDPR